ncbi:unnamed protein product [Urochloa humidicola]
MLLTCLRASWALLEHFCLLTRPASGGNGSPEGRRRRRRARGEPPPRRRRIPVRFDASVGAGAGLESYGSDICGRRSCLPSMRCYLAAASFAPSAAAGDSSICHSNHSSPWR